MGLRNSKKSVDIAASTGSPKKNGTEPTDVKVKELKDTPAEQITTTEIIEEVAAKIEETATPKANGDTPKEDNTVNSEDVPAVEVGLASIHWLFILRD